MIAPPSHRERREEDWDDYGYGATYGSMTSEEGECQDTDCPRSHLLLSPKCSGPPYVRVTWWHSFRLISHEARKSQRCRNSGSRMALLSLEWFECVSPVRERFPPVTDPLLNHSVFWNLGPDHSGRQRAVCQSSPEADAQRIGREPSDDQ